MSLLEDTVPVPSWLSGMRRFALDGALLLFDRETGLTARCEGRETAALARMSYASRADRSSSGSTPVSCKRASTSPQAAPVAAMPPIARP